MGSPAPNTTHEADRIFKSLGPRQHADLGKILESLLEDIDNFLEKLPLISTSTEPRCENLFDEIVYSASRHEHYAVPKLRNIDIRGLLDSDSVETLQTTPHSKIRTSLRSIEKLAQEAADEVLKKGSSDSIKPLEKALREAMEEVKSTLGAKEEQRPVTPKTGPSHKRSLSSPSTPRRPLKKQSFSLLDAGKKSSD